jgi:DNA polymerase-3 subunit alpha
MRFKVLQAFKKLKLTTDQRVIYKARVQKEINVLEQHNFCSYMLIVSDFIKRAREHGVRIGPGRGSVAGSLVAYLLRIHDVDPIEYDLLFERFHNKEKKAFPDIDTDMDPAGREWVEKYLVEKYGAKNVAHVSNLSTMTPKVTIKDIARSLEIGGSKSEAFRIANHITDTIPADAHTIDEALQASKEFRQYCEKYPQLEEYGRKLVGLEKTYATHAAGIVIGDVDLSTFVPLRIDKNGMVAVQYEKNRCEEMGLIKMDLLAIEHLSIVSDTIKNALVLEQQCPEPKDIPLDDIRVWSDASKGRTLGVFQMGSPHMIELCKKIKPKSIKDLSLVNALGRPSAAKSRDIYMARRDGREQVSFKYECLRPSLEATLGVGVYEEQLMKLANTVAGWDLNKADGLRKLTKLKGKNPELAEKLKLEFIANACEVSKITVNQAEEIWVEVIEPFSGYGFNCSHSIAYSINGYHTAYYKHYFPAAFMSAILKSEVNGNGADRDSNIRTYKREAKRLGLSIVAPDINRSGESYNTIDEHTLITGLTAVKGVGETAVKAIFEARDRGQFKSFADFLYRCNSSKVRKDSIQALAKAGAFDSLGITRRAAFTYYQDIRQRVNKYGDEKATQGIDEKYCTSGFEFERPDFNDEWPRPELLKAENEVLGEFLSGGINEVYGGFFTQNGVLFGRVKNIPDKTQIRIEAVVADVVESKFKAGKNKGKIFARCTITDIQGDPMTLTVWNENYLKYKHKLIVGKPFKAIAGVNEWNGSKSLILMDITE